MMDWDRWPLDAVSATALVARVTRDIDESTDDEVLALLSDLLCAAWGTRLAQDQ
jgi:hypothetical protein